MSIRSAPPPFIITDNETAPTDEGNELSREVSIDAMTQSDEVHKSMAFKVDFPEQWPNMDQLKSVTNWSFTKALLPSVKQALAHLDLLQEAIDEKYGDLEGREIVSRLSSLLSQTSLENETKSQTTKQQLRFSSAPSGRPAQVSTADRPQSLSIYGVGAHIELRPPSVIKDNVPYLGAKEVIAEVMLLLAKLENDRQTLLIKLEQEKERTATLKAKTDQLALKRMSELPVAVQREHEACAMDISELNWHVNYRSRTKERLQNKVQVATALNERLRKDIDFVSKHCPLVEEKLDLEKEAMDRIRQAQLDTNDELDVTTERFLKVKEKSEEAHKKATEERSQIRRDLDAVRYELDKITNELREAKETFERYTQKCVEARERLANYVEEMKILRVRRENAKSSMETAEQTLTNKQIRVGQEDHAQRALEDANYKKHNELQTIIQTANAKRKEMEEAVKKLEDRLKKVQRKNDEHRIDIEDLEKKINTCDKQQVADEKNIARMKKETERTEEQMRVTMEDLAQIQVVNDGIRERLMKEEDRCGSTEDNMKAALEGLRKQLKEEAHNKTVLAARINADNTELTAISKEAEDKSAKAQKKAADAENTVNTLEQKVDKLRAAKQERDRQLSDVQQRMEAGEQRHGDLVSWYNTEHGQLKPTYDSLTENVGMLERKLENMEWKREKMRKGIEEMNQSSVIIDKTTKNTQESIDAFTQELEELYLQIDARQKLNANLQLQLSGVIARNEGDEKRHEDYLTVRSEVLHTMQDELTEKLAENKRLAAEYRRLQNEVYINKNKELDLYSQRVLAEVKIKDLKQVRGLQLRMRGFLAHYLQVRNAYHRAELEHMETETGNSGVRVRDLQTRLDRALEDIEQFMQQQMDAGRVRQLAMERAGRLERGESVTPHDPTLYSRPCTGHLTTAS